MANNALPIEVTLRQMLPPANLLLSWGFHSLSFAGTLEAGIAHEQNPMNVESPSPALSIQISIRLTRMKTRHKT